MNDSLKQLLIDTLDNQGRTFYKGDRFVKPSRKGSRMWLTTYQIDELAVRSNLYKDVLVAKCWNEEDEKKVTIELNSLCVVI
jgi:hypothetical protein